MKKKFLALTLALTMTMGMTMTAFAEGSDKAPITEASESKTGTTVISYETKESYTVTLPADTALDTENDGYYIGVGDVKADVVLLGEGEYLTISLASANDFNLQYGSKNISKIEYTIVGEISGVPENYYVEFPSDEPFLTVVPNTASGSGAASGEAKLIYMTNIEAIAAATMAGEHKDTLTFTVSVNDTTTSGDFEIDEVENVEGSIGH